MGLIFHDMFSGTYKFTVYRKFLYTLYLNEIKKNFGMVHFHNIYQYYIEIVR